MDDDESPSIFIVLIYRTNVLICFSPLSYLTPVSVFSI